MQFLKKINLIDFMLLSDYNLGDSVSWKLNTKGAYDGLNVIGAIPEALLDMEAICQLNQFNGISNEAKNRILDLVLSNVDPSRIVVNRSEGFLVKEDMHHPSLSIALDVNQLKFFDEKTVPKTNFFRANYDELNICLKRVKWHDELSDLSVDEATMKFYEILRPFVNEIPKSKKCIATYPRYYTSDLIQLIKRKSP